MNKQDTVNNNVCRLAQQAHDTGVESGTVLTYRTGDAPEPVSPVKLMACNITYAGINDDNKPLLGFQLKDELLGTAPVAEVEPMRFATELLMQKKGYQLVGTRWVNPDEPAGAKAIELGKCKWKGLANNPEFLTRQGKVYSDHSSVGTTAVGTVGSAKPETLCNPIYVEGAPPSEAPKAPKAPKAQTIKEPTNEKLKKAGTGSKPKKCDATTKVTIKAWILAFSNSKELEAVHKLCGCKPLASKKGKEPSLTAKRTIYRNRLRKHWGM